MKVRSISQAKQNDESKNMKGPDGHRKLRYYVACKGPFIHSVSDGVNPFLSDVPWEVFASLTLTPLLGAQCKRTLTILNFSKHSKTVKPLFGFQC